MMMHLIASAIMEKKTTSEIFDLPLGFIDDSFGCFRLISPGSDLSILNSIRKYGQLLPVVVGPQCEGRYLLIDGFKRLRAFRKLGFEGMRAKVLVVGRRALKAAMIQLNRKAGSIRQIEEAMIVESFKREDNLSQVEIALLLGRHKSWVCRRIALVERLCDEVLNHLRLGLISSSHCRQLARLPRGNQERALSAILKHRLCCRETEQLVTILLESPRWEHESIVNFPAQILENRSAPRPKEKSARPLAKRLSHLKVCCLSIKEIDLRELSRKDRELICSEMNEACALLDHLRSQCAKRGPAKP